MIARKRNMVCEYFVDGQFFELIIEEVKGKGILSVISLADDVDKE